MSQQVICRCLGCRVTDEKRLDRNSWAMRDVFARVGVCMHCSRGANAAALREKYRTECLKARNTVAVR